MRPTHGTLQVHMATLEKRAAKAGRQRQTHRVEPAGAMDLWPQEVA